VEGGGDVAREVGVGVEHGRRLSARKVDLLQVDESQFRIPVRFEIRDPAAGITNEAPAGVRGGHAREKAEGVLDHTSRPWTALAVIVLPEFRKNRNVSLAIRPAVSIK
jgi:hypothetical protein